MGQGVGRDNKRSVFRIQVPQLVFPNGATGATLTQTEEVNIDGAVKQIMVGLGVTTATGATVTVSLIDKATGSILFTGEAVAEHATTVAAQLFMTLSGTDLPLHILSNKTITVSALISKDPGVSTGLCDITLMGD
jgi:hypothetical protein